MEFEIAITAFIFGILIAGGMLYLIPFHYAQNSVLKTNYSQGSAKPNITYDPEIKLPQGIASISISVNATAVQNAADTVSNYFNQFLTISIAADAAFLGLTDLIIVEIIKATQDRIPKYSWGRYLKFCLITVAVVLFAIFLMPIIILYNEIGLYSNLIASAHDFTTYSNYILVHNGTFIQTTVGENLRLNRTILINHLNLFASAVVTPMFILIFSGISLLFVEISIYWVYMTISYRQECHIPN